MPSPEQLPSDETCSQCGRPYSEGHRPDCPNLLAVKQEHRQWHDQAEGITDEDRERASTEQGRRDMAARQEASIAAFGAGVEAESAEADWEGMEARVAELQRLLRQAQEVNAEAKDEGSTGEPLRTQYFNCGTSVTECEREYQKLAEAELREPYQVGNLAKRIAAARRSLTEFIEHWG